MNVPVLIDRARARRHGLMASTAVIALACAHGAALAQSQPPSTGSAEAPQTQATPVQISQVQTAQAPTTKPTEQTSQTAAETITVTGTRIATPGLVSSNPIETITSVSIEDTGVQNLSTILQQLPEFSNNQGPSNSAGFVNGAYINAANLRSLGPYRTLVLIDGVRQVGQLSGVNNSGGTGIVDLNTIPPLAIDSIDVVTGGESPLYGADAVAGVVNIKLKRNFEGAEAVTEYGTTTDGGGTTTSFDSIFGANFAQNRGNITATFDYANTANITGANRPNQVGSGPQAPYFNFNNPSTVQSGFASGLYNKSGAPVIQGFFTGTPGTPTAIFTPVGNETTNPSGTALLPFNAGTPIPGTSNVLFGTGQGAVLDPNEILTPSNRRFVGESIVTYNLAQGLGPFKSLNANLDVKFASSRGVDWDSFPGFFAGIGVGQFAGTPESALLINADNPFLPTALAQQAAAAGANLIQISRQFDDWETRLTNYDYETNRDVFGFDGELENGWKFNTFFDYGRNQDTFINGSGSVTRLNQALDVVSGPGGVPICADTLVNPTDGCVPINPFKVGALSQAQQRFVFFDSKEVDITQEEDAQFNLTGDALHYATPFTHTDVPLGFAVGIEWRKEGTNALNDSQSQQAIGTNPDGSLFGGTNNLNQTFSNANANLPTFGVYTTKEAYLELSVPVLRDLPFAKAVDIGGAIRGQDFSSTGDDYTWALHGTWAFTSDLAFRASVGKSVRAPNGDELFSGGGQSFINIPDPCAAAQLAVSSAQVAANCHAHGVPAGFGGTGGPQASTILGGNLNIEAETGRTVTAGFVFTPTFLPRFNSTFDFFKVDIQNPIAFGDTGAILTGCYDEGIAADCALVTRNSSGFINTISTPYTNDAFEKEFGFDWSTNYRLDSTDLPFLPADSRLDLGTVLNYTPQHYLLSGAGQPPLQLAGQYGFQRWTGTFNAEYSQGPLSAGLVERFIGESALFEQVAGQAFSPADISAQWYTDLNASYVYQNFTFGVGVQNLFDNLPPAAAVAANIANLQTGPGQVARPGEEPFQQLDVTGRFVYTKLKISF
jgi:outer membrane receptor protein involved in Fe transport